MKKVVHYIEIVSCKAWKILGAKQTPLEPNALLRHEPVEGR